MSKEDEVEKEMRKASGFEEEIQEEGRWRERARYEGERVD